MRSKPISAKEAISLLNADALPPGTRLLGEFSLVHFDRTQLPEDLECDLLDLSGSAIEQLPAGLRAYELNLSNTRIKTLPADLKVEAILRCDQCHDLEVLPAGLTVYHLGLQGCQSLTRLPEGLDVWSLDLTGCWAFKEWPKEAAIRSGRLNLRGCAALTYLPEYLGRLAAVNLRDCPNLMTLPDGLRISGWIDLAQCGVADSKKLPASLEGVDIRWQGVRIDERILCHPETIQVAEILSESNAERRRVLVNRFGVARFMQEAQAEVLDNDVDPGGPRQLLRVEMSEDEPLVTLSCFCPSTKRQYFLRVPPATATCHQAAAWIAGFDIPDDYHPLIET